MSNLPAIIQERGILPEVFSALKNSIFPGASDESVVMAWDYCAARKLDVMLKPVHLVPMSVKDAKTGKSDFRDVVMPGIGLYRIQADRAGNYAGMSAPVFGPEITEKFQATDYNNKPFDLSVTYPEWCEITVSKLIGERLVTFTAREYWIENYATAGKNTKAPNVMWQKRPRGQLVKCAEAQALRKGWPELGAQPTYEEMEGKEIVIEKDITPRAAAISSASETLSQDQISRLEKAIEFAGLTQEAFCAHKSIRIANIAELPSARFEGAMNYLRGLSAQEEQEQEHVNN